VPGRFSLGGSVHGNANESRKGSEDEDGDGEGLGSTIGSEGLAEDECASSASSTWREKKMDARWIVSPRRSVSGPDLNADLSELQVDGTERYKYLTGCIQV